MKSSNVSWRDQLQSVIDIDLAQEIDIFETEIELRKQGKLDEKLFAETRLRRGVYGQRYDNGQRYDGRETRQLRYPSGDLTKGPTTVWDAPGMQRIKVPFGGLNPRQLETMAELTEEYSDGIAHVTTRQDFQLHFIHIEDTPALMRRLAAVGLTTREACGNVVRNVTACPLAGVCHTEAFDVTPYADALATFLLGHPDTQDFGRKFKVAFSGCAGEACGLVNMHDMGAIGLKRINPAGREERGFALYVGGGLGTVPHQAKLFDAFLPEAELLPTAQAIARVFARLGEKKNRNRARIKFLVAQLGIDEFKRLVLEERTTLPDDPEWTDFLAGARQATAAEPLQLPAQPRNGTLPPEGFDQWRKTNTYAQRQPGYLAVTIKLPLGDLTPAQLRALADLARRFTHETLPGANTSGATPKRAGIRTTVEQNILFRWVLEADLVDLFQALKPLGLGEPGAGTIVDVTSCPGTDTCKLGIASSRGLAGELSQRLAAQSHTLDEAVQGLHIKISGCFNSCGQHHVADLGFYGVSRHVDGYTVPHFQVVLGGQWQANAGAYGLAIGAVPAKRIPEVVQRLTGRYVAERQAGETFRAYIQRIGKVEVKRTLDEFTAVPPHAQDPSYYSDWGDPREFTTGDMGVGECAGEVVSRVDFDLAAAEREVFEAEVLLDAGDYQQAGERAYNAMLQSAKALVRTQFPSLPNDPDRVVAEFKTRFYDTQLFWDPYAGGKFGHYLLRAHEKSGEPYWPEVAHQRIEEAQLVVEAAYSCRARIGAVTILPAAVRAR